MTRVRIPSRRRGLFLAASVVLLGCAACSEGNTVLFENVALDLVPVVSGLSSPVYLTGISGDTRLFIVEQAGRIRVVKNGQLLATPFLDISSRVLSGGERGLLSMAFDPAYAGNGYFYLYFTSQPSGDIVIERHGGTPGADVASATATSVLSIPHPLSNHNGGLVMFGPDGMLYTGTGDGGGGGDPSGNGQNLNSLLGKLLRIDVRTLPYTIPATNPFAGQSGRRGEIWAYGLRNPWRFAFDRLASPAVLYIADVGQNRYEEINVANAATGGINYGWNVTEGAQCYPSGNACSTVGQQLPALEYDHARGCSITGGFPYRGATIPELVGQYFFSDYCTGFLASMSGNSSSNVTTNDWSVPNVGNVTSFGQDGAGEVYLLSANGTVYRIVRK